MPLPCSGYQPRDAERGVLYRVVDAHLDAFLNATAHHAEGIRLPAFVEQEFRDFLTLWRASARLRPPAVRGVRVRAARAVLLQVRSPFREPTRMLSGAPFAFTLLAVLGIHEVVGVLCFLLLVLLILPVPIKVS